MKKEDQIMPKDKWEFDDDVSECFDNMLQRSIPQYDVMRQAVTSLAQRYQTEGTYFLDLGTSLGESIRPLMKLYLNSNFFLGLEIAEPMLEALRTKFEKEIGLGRLRVKKHDLREGVPQVPSCVVLSILTLQFTPIEYRQMILESVYKTLKPGGAFILVEKVLGSNSAIDKLLVGIYHEMKRENDYTQEQIERKKLSLEGVLVPVTAKWNEDLLTQAGFQDIECFWRWMNFAGWIGVKK